MRREKNYGEVCDVTHVKDLTDRIHRCESRRGPPTKTTAGGRGGQFWWDFSCRLLHRPFFVECDLMAHVERQFGSSVSILLLVVYNNNIPMSGSTWYCRRQAKNPQGEASSHVGQNDHILKKDQKSGSSATVCNARFSGRGLFFDFDMAPSCNHWAGPISRRPCVSQGMPIVPII